MCIEPRTPIYFYYRLIRLAPISIYKLSTSYLQAPCSNRYLGYRRILNNAHRTSRKKWPKFPNLVPDLDNPNQLFETHFGDMKFQPFQRINGSPQFGNISGKLCMSGMKWAGPFNFSRKSICLYGGQDTGERV